jgi:uncharacterized glyoxalase superfamily protein PhnB
VEILDLKVFVPSKDYELSKKFYVDLGFKKNWENPQTTEFELSGFRFLLQNFYDQKFVSNFMMHLTVENADNWFEHFEKAELAQKYPGATSKAPAIQPWGLRVLYMTDPSGVLWHIADQRID